MTSYNTTIKTIGLGFIAVLFLASIAFAVEFSPQGNINLKDRYNITNISAIIGGFSFIGNLTLPSPYWLDADTESENVKSPPANPGTGYAISHFVSNFSTAVVNFFNIDGQNWLGNFNAMGYNLTNISYSFYGTSNSGYIYDNGTALIIGRS